MSQFSAVKGSGIPRRQALAGALAATLLVSTDATAFLQQTTLEGTVGTDIGGVWLSVQHIMPEFRITYPKPAEGRAVPFTVGPIPADLEPATGKNPKGVVVAECTEPAVCEEQGILVGDIILALNSAEVADPAAFEARIKDLPASVMLSMRRPAIRMTTAKLLKIRYGAGAAPAEGTSTLGEEKVDLRILDVALPFAKQVEATRTSNSFFEPTAADLEALGKGWAELPPSSPVLFVNGKHRFVSSASYDDALAGDKGLKDTRYAIVMDLEANPIRGAGGKVIDIYGLETVDSRTIEGSYVTATIESAPFPINVEFKGRFRMTRVADWSDADDKARAAKAAANKPAEDLKKYELAPDVPPPAAAEPKH
jgi:hypothetical protein